MEWKMSRRFTSPFPPLALASEDAGELEALARVFVSESVSNYERFLFDDHAQVDERRWKFMYEKENVRSYAERRRDRDGRHDSYADDIPIHSASSSADLPIVMVTGTIEGDLDDTIFGFVCPTLDMMRIKTAYIKDGLYRGCVLASLIQPSVDDPFRSLSIKWVEKGNPIHIRAVVKNRDFVYMESTGVEYLRNGERVGYQLVHSVQFPQTPELGTSIRGNMSMSAVYRQKDHQVVEVFLKGFLNPAGGLMRSIITRSAAKALLSVSQNVYCAQMKKLAWTIRQHRNRTCRSDTASSTGGVIADHDEMWCKMCAKKKTSLLPGGKRKKRRTCRLCGNYVCSKCRIDHKLHFMLSDRRMVQQSMAFCASCLHLALDAKTLPIARHELMFNDLYEWSEPRAGSSGTEISLVDYLN